MSRRSCVSRETHDRLDMLVTELVRWQAIKNLVGPDTLQNVWERHVADSLQLAAHQPARGGLWVDLGSGAGFPGLVMAVLRTERAQGTTVMVESNARKCAFLRHVIRLGELDAEVMPARIDAAVPMLAARTTAVVSARALASLSQLLGWSFPLLRTGAVGIFPKGQDVERELQEAAISWSCDVALHPSLTDCKARIVVVHKAEPKGDTDVRP
jgi:16S rRNA (guanine527-N7)-methyltransferase